MSVTVQPGKLYRITRKADILAQIHLKGNVSVKILGRKSEPTALSAMTNILADDETLTGDQWGLYQLPSFISFEGTADLIEIEDIFIEEIGDIE